MAHITPALSSEKQGEVFASRAHTSQRDGFTTSLDYREEYVYLTSRSVLEHKHTDRAVPPIQVRDDRVGRLGLTFCSPIPGND